MARQIKGRLFKRGKNNYFYLQYYLNGQQIVKSLKDENGNSITSKAKAQKAADLILAPYMAKDNLQRRKQAADALKTAQEKAIEIERRQNAIKLRDAFTTAMKKPKAKQASVARRKSRTPFMISKLFPDMSI